MLTLFVHKGILIKMKIGSNNPTFVQALVEEETDPAILAEIAAIQIPKATPQVQLKYRGLPPFATENDCRRTSEFPHMKFSCEWFNPLQTAFLPEVEKDNNVVISGRTSSGKTVIAEMVISYTLGAFKKHNPAATAAYISPLKALAAEKEQDWTNAGHWFSQYNISILTGDYVLTDERKSELARADIVAMSSEMLGSRTRRNQAEKNLWLNNLACIIIDESHLLSTDARGPNLEVALMKFSKVNPNCRIIFLSATMPNVADLGKWLTKLNGKPTAVVASDYRPVKLDWHWELFDWSADRSAYKRNEASKVQAAVSVVQKYPEDKFIVFVHGKKTGRMVLEMLNNRGISAQFHNADAKKDQREQMERDFRSREPGSLRVIVATSTLAMGLNMPARRVVVTGIHRGIELVDSLDITQMCGRSGRVGVDSKGDAHVLIRHIEGRPAIEKEDIAFCQKVEPVTSKITTADAVAFHLVSEISEGQVFDIASAQQWFSRSLAHHQKLLGEDDKVKALIVEVLTNLLKFGAIKKSKDARTLEATTIGKIASWFYFNPFDVAGWASNFRTILSDQNPPSIKDLSWALGHTHTRISEYELKIADQDFQDYLRGFPRPFSGGANKHCYALHCILSDVSPKAGEFHGIISGYRIDCDRICAAVSALHSMGHYFDDYKHHHVIYELPYRLKYGIKDKGLELVMLPGIGKKTAEQIMGRRIYSCKELLAAQSGSMPVLAPAKWEKVKNHVKEIAHIGHVEYLKRQNGRNHRAN